MRAVTLQPAAGAQGELTGILMIRAYHRERGDVERDEVLVPDSSPRHQPGDGVDGRLHDDHHPVGAPTAASTSRRFRAALGPRTAAVMITNPSTLGPVRATHRRAARARSTRPARWPTWTARTSTPSSAGSSPARPASTSCTSTSTRRSARRTAAAARAPARSGWGSACCRTCPRRGSCATDDGTLPPGAAGRAPDLDRPAAQLRRQHRRPRARVRLHPGARRRAACARSATTPSSRPTTSRHRLAGTFDLPYDRACKHEFVASASSIKARTGVRTLDIAKRLIDHGFHPPTIYFPLIVDEGMLIEPTETESRRDARRLRRRADRHRRPRPRPIPRPSRAAPHTAPVQRLDEATAARQPNLRWRPMAGAETPCPD